MPSIITRVSKCLLKKIISFYNNLKAMVTTRLQRSRQTQQNQQRRAAATAPATKTAYSSTKKMQELRQDKKYVHRQEYLRVMRKVEKDEAYRPTHIVIRKYAIPVDEINRVRATKRWPPIDIHLPPLVTPTPANVIQSELNTETKFNMTKLAEASRLEINEKAGAVEAFQERLKEANKGKIVEVDREDLFSISTIIQYFIRNPGTPGRSNEERRPNTLKSYFGIITKDGQRQWDGKSGIFARVFNNWKEGHCSKDIRPCLQQVDDIINWLENEQQIWRKSTSKLAALTPLLVVLSEYPPLRDQPLAKRTLAKLENYKSKLDAEVRVAGTERREQESVSPFSDIKQAIYDKFQKKNDSPTPTGKIDKAWIYIQMYEEQPVRDDLGTLKIMFEDVPEQLTNRVDKNFKDPLVKKELLKINNGNILYVPDDARKQVTLAFHVYKTSSTYGVTFVDYSLQLSTDIRLYIDQLKNKMYLFGKGKMTAYVGKMLLDAGVKKKSNDPEYRPGFNTGSVNLLRKSYVSRALNDPSLSAVDRETLAFAMKHSPMTSPSYLREHGLKITDEQKNELKKITYDNNI